MSSQPYLRAADDGTFELLVPSGTGSIHVLPYCFHTEKDAANWLASCKGKQRIQQIRPECEKAGAGQPDSNAAVPGPKSIESLVVLPRPIAAEAAPVVWTDFPLQ
jgi:hypothetical protein